MRIPGCELAPLAMQNVNTSSYSLRTVDMEREEIELTGSGRLLVAGFDGAVVRSEELRLAWDGYREDGTYRVFWNTAGGSGVHPVLKGRLINSAAMSPAGDLVAVSVSRALNIGDIRDSIYVFRTRDGVEVFRRYLPLYTRTQVVFLSHDLMAYTAGDQVVVLRVCDRAWQHVVARGHRSCELNASGQL